MENKQHFFYVLECADDTLYAGYTTNLERRQKEHNDGVGAKYTRVKKRRPVKIIHTEIFSSRSEATKAEYAFKQLKKADKLKYMHEKQ